MCGNSAERVRKAVSIERGGKRDRKRRGYSEEWLLFESRGEICRWGVKTVFFHTRKSIHYPARTLKIHFLQQESFLRQRRVKTLLPEGYFAGLKQNFAWILIEELAVLEKERERFRILQRQLLYFGIEERALRAYVTYSVESSVCLQSKVRVL